MDLSKLIAEEYAKLEDQGKIREMVAKHLTECINSSIKDTLRSLGEGGKIVEERVKKAIGLELRRVDFNTAVVGVGRVVEAAVNQYITETTHPVLVERLNEIFRRPPEHLSLQDLIDEYKEDIDKVDVGSEAIGLVFKQAEGWSTDLGIGLNPTLETRGVEYSSSFHDVDKVEDCEISIYLNRVKGSENLFTFSYIWFGTHVPTSTKNFLPSVLYGFHRRLFQMYACGTKLKVTSTNIDDYETRYLCEEYY